MLFGGNSGRESWKRYNYLLIQQTFSVYYWLFSGLGSGYRKEKKIQFLLSESLEREKKSPPNPIPTTDSLINAVTEVSTEEKVQNLWRGEQERLSRGRCSRSEN